MSENLVESILDKNFVLAESLLQEKLNSIMEKKLYEKKRMVAADMNEALGGLTRQEIEDRKKRGFKKAADVLPDPRDIKIKPLVKIKKKVSEAVEVQPDPEGKVRGGKIRSGLSRAQRRVARIGLSAIRAIEKKKKAYTPQQSDDSIWKKSAGAEPSQPKEVKKKENTDSFLKKDYTGAGNTPTAMAGRLAQHVMSKSPSAPGSGTLKATKWLGRTIGGAIAQSIGEETK
jgi:hypothetical protein